MSCSVAVVFGDSTTLKRTKLHVLDLSHATIIVEAEAAVQTIPNHYGVGIPAKMKHLVKHKVLCF